MSSQEDEDARYASQLQAQENQLGGVPGAGAIPVATSMPMATGNVPVVQGTVVQGTAVGGGGGGAPVFGGVPVAYGSPGYGQGYGQAGPGYGQGYGQPGPYGAPMQQQYGQPSQMYMGNMPGMVSVIQANELPVEEVIVLNYRFSMLCFASIDAVFTILNVGSVLFNDRREDEQDPKDDDENQNMVGLEGIDSKWFAYIGLVFLIGPICGLVGARRLHRGLVTIYLVFCVGKTIFEIVVAVLSPYFWLIVIALIQIWITKIVFTFWKALGAITPERCKELLDPHAADGLPVRGPVRMVYW